MQTQAHAKLNSKTRNKKVSASNHRKKQRKTQATASQNQSKQPTLKQEQVAKTNASQTNAKKQGSTKQTWLKKDNKRKLTKVGEQQAKATENKRK